MYKSAIILGNGENRRGIDIPDNCDVWACNLAFKEPIPIDFLVATDVHRQHEIYVSGYANDNICMFLDWTPVPAEATTPEILQMSGFKTKQNEPTGNDVVISGWNNTMFFTYLNDTDCVKNIKMNEIPRRFSSGSLAMWLAAEQDYDEILLAGFGDEKHIYRDYAEGVDIPHTDLWKEERDYIIEKHPEINWRYL